MEREEPSIARRYEVNAVHADVPTRVTVVDFDMSFGNLVIFFVKATLAAIPAGIILAVLLSVVVLAFGMLLGGFGMMR